MSWSLIPHLRPGTEWSQLAWQLFSVPAGSALPPGGGTLHQVPWMATSDDGCVFRGICRCSEILWSSNVFHSFTSIYDILRLFVNINIHIIHPPIPGHPTDPGAHGIGAKGDDLRDQSHLRWQRDHGGRGTPRFQDGSPGINLEGKKNPGVFFPRFSYSFLIVFQPFPTWSGGGFLW